MLFKNNKGSLSITKRVTIWYGVFFIVLSGFLFSAIYLTSNYYITQSAHSQLETSVIDSVSDYAEDDFKMVDNGVYLSRYTTAGELVEGSVPIPLTGHFKHVTLSEFQMDNNRYLYYDYFDNSSKNWFRGILSVRQNDLITQNLLLILMILIPFSLLIVLGGGYLIIRRALIPIKAFSVTAQHIASSLDLTQRMEFSEAPKELHQLGQSFNRMLQTVETSYMREQQFTSDVSHELRTPLTVMQSELEFLQTLPNHSEDTFEALSVLDRQTRQMAKLVRNLLEMTRMEKESSIILETIDFSALLLEQIENYLVITEVENKKISYQIADNLILSGNSELLKRLIDNLLSNAVKFSSSRIAIKAYSDPEFIGLEVRNDGVSIPPEDLEKIWDRLYQGDASRNRTGLGLGLSFVKKIASLHHAIISVESQNGETIFKVFFPFSS